MGREVRMVPADWQHPKDGGRYKPLLSGSFEERLQEWETGKEKWNEGLRADWNGGWKELSADEKAMSYEDWDGFKPACEDYMPAFEDGEATHFMMYENTTEGTPISPAFATPEELARWLADSGASAFAGQTATYEAWLSTCKSGSAPSAMFSPQTGLVSGVEGINKPNESA